MNLYKLQGVHIAIKDIVIVRLEATYTKSNEIFLSVNKSLPKCVQKGGSKP